MEQFVARHAEHVIGTLSGFDRLVFRGTLRMLAHRGGMMSYLSHAGVLLKQFGGYAEGLTRQLIEASTAAAQRLGRTNKFLPSAATSKEAIAREIAVAEGIQRGLICVLGAVEQCMTYTVVRDRANQRIELEPRWGKCKFLYHYRVHPRFGFMHARIQTWFPFAIQVCINGREWLARSMDAAGLSYRRRDNCFTWLEHPERAQRMMQRQVQQDWPALLDAVARGLNPAHTTMFGDFPMDYYWSCYQSEWATDVMFRDPAVLRRLYPTLVHHGLTTFLSPDVMRFLGRKLLPSGDPPPRFAAEVVSDVKHRPEGVRIKHRVGDNSVKMYDKQGSVLRVETTINDVDHFKTFRAPENQPEAAPGWQRMRKGVADLPRRAEVSQAANERYLTALASVEQTVPLGELTARLCRPATYKGRRVRALNPHAPGDAALLAAISRGEFTLNGLRNRDLRALLFARPGRTAAERKRQAAAISRKLCLLRAHHLIRKVPHTHRYHLTEAGRTLITALMAARNANTQELTKIAA